MVTNRLLRFGEVYCDTQSQSFNLTAGEIDLNDQDKSKSTGVLIPCASSQSTRRGRFSFRSIRIPGNWSMSSTGRALPASLVCFRILSWPLGIFPPTTVFRPCLLLFRARVVPFFGMRCPMKIYRYLAVLCCLFVLPLLLTNFVAGNDTKKKIKSDVCSASNPAVFVPRRTLAAPLPLPAPSTSSAARVPMPPLRPASPTPSPTKPSALRSAPRSRSPAALRTPASSLTSAAPTRSITRARSWAAPIVPSPSPPSIQVATRIPWALVRPAPFTACVAMPTPS